MRVLLLFLSCLLLLQCRQNMPAPTEVDKGESGLLERREQYLELSHRIDPALDWRAENDKAMLDVARRVSLSSLQADGPQSYADGQLSGQWFERGSLNQAGSVLAVDYVPATNQVYTIGDGGSLWRSNLDMNNWTCLNNDLRFSRRQLRVIPNGAGGQRILTVIGKRVYYSDDEGANFTQSGGLSFYDDWGRSVQLVATEESSGPEVYFLVLTWDNVPWASRIQLWYSADRGQNFSMIQSFNQGNTSRISMWQPYGTGDCYLMDRSSTIYKIDGGTVSTFSTNTTLPTNVNCQLRGHRAANGALTLYAMTNQRDVYRSTNNGSSWQLRSSTPADAWTVGIEVALNNSNQVFFGEVNCYRSANGAGSWELVNEWWEYYGDVPGKLHADIMDIEFFKRSNGQEFALISNHGGLSISYDYLQTTYNLSLTGLNVSQYYDVRTDPTDANFVYAGSQDQGYQRASGANSLPYAPLDFDQIVSGDYGHMVFSGNGQRFWKQYPGGSFSYHHLPKTSDEWWDSEWQLPGNNLPNVGWMVPTAEFAHQPAQNKILVGGGNINGGSGSYLIELTAANNSPYSITATQDAYNFQPNSNSGNALISAVAVGPLNGRRYVATDDGTFFRKNTNGSWQKASGFDGPDGFYLYGSHILPSKINPDLVWFAGSGYSNPAVWKSTDGGQSFTAMNNGLPGTLVQEMAASPDEKFLFAATDAGPFVYSVATDTWYTLRSPDMPLQTIYSVEFIASRNIVRFGTYGRGIWDFVIDNLSLSGVAFDATCGPNSGEIKVNATGGLSPLTYQWSNGALSTNLNNLSGGTYTLTVTDGNGFTRTAGFSIAGDGKPPKPINLRLPSNSCGPVTCTWDGPGSGTYQLRYKQGNTPFWTVLGNIGNIYSYTLNFDADAGLPYAVGVRYVCPGGQLSAWVNVSGTLMDCDLEAPKQHNVSIKAVGDRSDFSIPAVSTISVYPNPASEFFMVTLPAQTGPSRPLQLFDFSGKLVLSQAITEHESAQTMRLDVSHLPKGVYWLVWGKENSIKVCKM